MRRNTRESRFESTVAPKFSVRSLSRAVSALVAIGGLAACSADQSLSSAPKQQASLPVAPAPMVVVYVSDSSGVQQLWKVVNGATSRLTFSNAVDKDPHSAAGHLVFASYRDGDEEIYMGKNDLSGLKRLTVSAGEDEQPKLSPECIAHCLRELPLGRAAAVDDGLDRREPDGDRDGLGELRAGDGAVVES